MHGPLQHATLLDDGRELLCHQCHQVTRDPTQVGLLYCPTCGVFHVPADPEQALQQGITIGKYLLDRSVEDLKIGRPAP